MKAIFLTCSNCGEKIDELELEVMELTVLG